MNLSSLRNLVRGLKMAVGRSRGNDWIAVPIDRGRRAWWAAKVPRSLRQAARRLGFTLPVAEIDMGRICRGKTTVDFIVPDAGKPSILFRRRRRMIVSKNLLEEFPLARFHL